MTEYTRRQFLYDSLMAAAAAATAAATPNLLAAENLSASASPNEKLNFAIIGVNGRGNNHIRDLTGKLCKGDVNISIICDVDETVGNRRCEEVSKKQEHAPKYVRDLRQVFDDKSIDCVTIATPNHWHSLAAIWAMQAGKDVYVEKPVCHNISEGERVVETARKYKKICQTGTQCRSNPANIQAMDYIRSGKIGEVKLARGLCYKPRPSIGPAGWYDVPSNIDYNLWTGPAPFHEKSPYKGSTKSGPVHYDWHWRWDTGNGDLGNQGIHQMDLCRWALGVEQLAQGVITYGGRFGYVDAGETPNTEVVVLDYGTKSLVFEVRGLKTESFKGAGVGIIIEGTDGYVVMPTYTSGAAFNLQGEKVQTFSGGNDDLHYANFIKAVRSRKKEDLNADIQDGFLSSALCHLGNISFRLGEKVPAEEIANRLKAVKMSDNAQDTLDQVVEHLASNDVKLDGDDDVSMRRLFEIQSGDGEFRR